METNLEQKLKNYRPSPAAVELIKSTPILVLVGPSGVGKDSIKERLLKTGRYHHIVSHTTRQPRINHGVVEQDGVEYHFIDKTTAETMLDNQSMIEAKLYSGNLYGTSAAEIQAAHDEGKIAMTDIEVQGVEEYKTIDPKVMAVFLLPPDFKTLQARLQKRYGGKVDTNDLRLRLKTSLNELDHLLKTDYYLAVINDNLEAAYEHIDGIVQSKDHVAADEPEARAVAKKLSEDISEYLDQIA